MGDIRANQFGMVAPVSSATAPLRTNQFGAIAVTSETPIENPIKVNQIAAIAPATASSDLQVSQFAIIAVISPNSRVITPTYAIGLECWQPCLSYGTNAIVYWRK